MRSAILSSVGGFFLLLVALCLLAPSKISASPLALPQLGSALTQRSALAAADGETLDFTRALKKRKGSKSSGGKKKKGKISKGAIAAIVIIIIIIIIAVLVFLWLKKRKAGGH
ncbi:MAG: hypothetical protein M1839_001771 [Geoglossum umbratile]|nr:MAG: hypothetical protein M1839_001771 [Geoglossum umbratile]